MEVEPPANDFSPQPPQDDDEFPPQDDEEQLVPVQEEEKEEITECEQEPVVRGPARHRHEVSRLCMFQRSWANAHFVL
jgi:hypothetical protein